MLVLVVHVERTPPAVELIIRAHAVSELKIGLGLFSGLIERETRQPDVVVAFGAGGVVVREAVCSEMDGRR